jgi:FtsH-binding integral membrane protein
MGKEPYARSELSKNINYFLGGDNKQTGGGKPSIFKSNLSNLFKLITDKKEFFIMVFANLIAQIGITYYVMEKVNLDVNDKETTLKIRLLGFLQILIVIILAFVPMPSWLKLIIFCGFSAVWGCIFSVFRSAFGEDAVKMAMMGTISIFALMFAFGAGLILSGIQLGYKVGLMLFYFLLILLLIRIIQLFIPSSSLTTKIITICSLLLFSVYIVYDTNSILQRNYYGDFITASMDYYLDILNIFVNLLSFGSSN